MLSPPGRLHPVLLEIPIPRWSFPLRPALLALALALLVVAGLGRRARSADLVVTGLVGAAAAGLGALLKGPAVVHTAPIPLYGFGFLVASALIIGWTLATRHAGRAGLSRNDVSSCCFVTAAAGLAGARLLYVLTNLGDFRTVGDVLSIENGGLVFYGGVLGGLVGSLAYTRAKKIPWLAWADLGAPSLALGSVIGRLGCYLAGCDYGLPLGPRAPAWLARLGTFPRWPDDVAGPGAGSPAFIDHVLTRGVPFDAAASLPVHPTQLYESLGALALFAVLLAVGARRSFRGEVFLAFVTGYGMLRFWLETVRDDPERGLYGPHAAPELVVAVAGTMLAVAFALGAAAAFRRARERSIARIFAFAPALVAYLVLRSAHGGAAQLSTSQWIALVSSLAAAVAWRKLLERARSTPDGGPPPAAGREVAFTGGGLSS